MINTQLASQIANTQKNDLKIDNSASKDKTNLKDNPKEALAQALKQNLGLSKDASSEEILAKFVQNETGVKLKELVNKLLDQINAQKNPDSPVLKQGKNLNLAPNFANELKILSTELAKSDTFTQVLDRLNKILKNASEITTHVIIVPAAKISPFNEFSILFSPFPRIYICMLLLNPKIPSTTNGTMSFNSMTAQRGINAIVFAINDFLRINSSLSCLCFST